MQWSRHTHRFGLAILSIFILWHVVAISIVGPFGNSYLRQNLMRVYQDYLAIFHLNRAWAFYSPNPFTGSMLSYQTTAISGELQTYPLSRARGKFAHAYFRYTNFYAYLLGDPTYSQQRGYDKSVANFLCRQHQADLIKEIHFVLLSQGMVSHEDYRQGKRPLDEGNLVKSVFGPYLCTAV